MGTYTLEEGNLRIFNKQGLPSFQEALHEGEKEMQWSVICDRN